MRVNEVIISRIAGRTVSAVISASIWIDSDQFWLPFAPGWTFSSWMPGGEIGSAANAAIGARNRTTKKSNDQQRNVRDRSLQDCSLWERALPAIAAAITDASTGSARRENHESSARAPSTWCRPVPAWPGH